jgi:hypothetical protein
MSRVFLTEHTSAGRYGGGVIPVADTGQWLENANSPINVTGVAANSAPFGPNTSLIRIHTDTVCSVWVTTAGTSATTNNARMAANQTEYWYVHPGQILSVIANT